MATAATSQVFYASSLECHSRGWSVIPLVGGNDPENGKRPVITWQSYQNRIPTANELHHWFVTCSYSAFGVLCGTVSHLIVIDFDDAAAAEKFKRQFPNLVNTFTVRSGFRQTPHFYFRVDFPVKSCKLNGGDLKAEGSYVVGAGSKIAGKEWILIHDVPPLQLLKSQLKQVLKVFKTVEVRETKIHISPQTTSNEFIAFYRREVLKSGQRNNSLFKTALWMRDSGYAQHEAIAALAHIHTNYPNLSHQKENSESRYREAVATIASAYSRPPRQRTIEADETGSRLSNTLREALLKQPDGAAFLRTYEGLFLNGIAGGQIVTRPQMFNLLHGIVGEHSIKLALKTTAPNGKRLFDPSPRPPTPAGADTDVLNNKANKCFVDRQESPERGWHRPAKRYVVPTEAELQGWFGLSKQTSLCDSVELHDLSSAKKYRQTLELKLIERKPGQYPQGWLADRLGVSIRTIYNYHKSLPVETVASYTVRTITWDNIQTSIPSEAIASRAGIDIRGRFLEDERGKRYPAIAGLAQKLLAKGHHVLLKQRTFNFYHVKTETDIKVTSVQKPGQTKYFERPEYKIASFQPSSPEINEIVIPTSTNESVEYLLSIPEQAARTPDTDQIECLALQVKALTGAIDNHHAMSLKNAVHLIELYGICSVRKALYTLQHLHKRDKVKNPAGFMVIASRVNWRKQQSSPAITPRFRPLSGRKRPSKTDAKYDSFWHLLQLLICWMDEDYLQWRIELENDWLDEAFLLSKNSEGTELPF